MSVVEAKRLCPKLIMLPVNFDLYQDYSEKFFGLLGEYVQEIEKGSIDEGFIDVTEISDDIHPLDLAKEIQNRLLKEFKLPVSIGIAPNMFLAKMASDMKKPLGITVLRKRDVEEKLWPLPIEDMYGIGKKTYPNLKLLGINTIGDLVKYDNDKKLAINRIEEFRNKAKGIGSNRIDPYRHVDMKSIGNSSTYLNDLYEYQEILEKLSALARKVTSRVQDDNSACKTISIQVRYNDFTQINRSYTVDYHTDNFFEIYEVVERLYDNNQSDKPIRLLGVSTSNLIESKNNIRQLNIFKIDEYTPKEEAVKKLLDTINDEYGQKIIKKGSKN